MGLEWKCDDCGYMKDTPNHEWGCETGREEYGHEKEAPKRTMAPYGNFSGTKFYEDFFDEEWDEWHDDS